CMPSPSQGPKGGDPARRHGAGPGSDSGRVAAAHRARSAPPALRPRLAATTFPRPGAALVGLATPPPGTCQTGTYQTPATQSISATVVLSMSSGGRVG